MPEPVALLCKVYLVVDEQPRTSAIQCHVCLSTNDGVVHSFGAIFFFQEVRKLQDHIRLCRHHLLLNGCEVVAGHNIPPFSCNRVLNMEHHVSCLLHQHNTP